MQTAFIFDLDGVIVDTARFHYLAWQRLASQLGFSFTERDNEALKGVSRMKSLDIILELGNLSFNESERQELADRKNQWYVEMLQTLDQSHVLPGAGVFIHTARQKGIKTALGSASKNARTILEKLDLLAGFDAIVDGTMTSRAKPDPEVFLMGAEMLGVPPENCVVFEDAQAGIEAALASGMKVVGIGDEQQLKNADLVLPSLDQITPEFILSETGLHPK